MADPTIPDLGQFPIIQFGLFIVTVGAGLAVWWRGQRKKLLGDDSRVEGSGVQLFFDGPLKAALDKLEGTYRILLEMKGENERTVAEFRERHKDELEISNRANVTLEKILEELRRLPSVSQARRRRAGR